LPAESLSRCAFVSTNSICQGEQVGILWSALLAHNITICFAHRTFAWNNEAKGKAAVHCVIVGFARHFDGAKRIYEYDDIRGAPQESAATNISPYLVDGPNVLLPSRTTAPPNLPQLLKGSQPTDGGHLILNDEQRDELVSAEPAAKRWLRRYMGGEEFLNGGVRWCLWLKGASPSDLKSMPKVMERVKGVARARRESPTKSVREFAAYPTLFTQDRQPTKTYIALPEVSSESRRFIPVGFLDPKVVASNQLQVIEGGTLFHFAILCSTMHNAWMRTVAGRLKSDYRYSPAVYNNLPWPNSPSDTQKQRIEAAAQAVLDARAEFPDSSLADLYAPLAMPPALVKAHQRLDAAVDAAYGRRTFKSDAERVAYLFGLYQEYTSLLPGAPVKGARTKSSKRSVA
jgi:hypothetical protein